MAHFAGIDEHLPEAVNKALDKEVTPNGSLLSSGRGLHAAKPVVTQIIVSFPKLRPRVQFYRHGNLPDG